MGYRLDHVQLAIPEGGEDLADTFYVGLLGLVCEDKPPVLAARGGRWYRRDALVVHLGVEADFRPARKAHPALVVDDYDELAARLSLAGYAIRPDDALDDTRRFYVDDPHGNRLEVMEATSAR
jgi:catechol 2,3-dioxygenase-like lactoylglutathione lyase family enzyme